MQCVVKMKMPLVNAEIVARLEGNYVQLSMNKFASNALETLLACAGETDVAKIVQEIMCSNEFLNVLQDPFGNFVVQRALKFTKVRTNSTHIFDRLNISSYSNHLNYYYYYWL